MINTIEELFEYIYSDEHSMKNKNKAVLLFIDGKITTREYDVINEYINDDRLADLHPSLIFSSYLMVRDSEIFLKEKLKAIKQNRVGSGHGIDDNPFEWCPIKIGYVLRGQRLGANTDGIEKKD